jgi:predicted RND superfamily exporter protein
MKDKTMKEKYAKKKTVKKKSAVKKSVVKKAADKKTAVKKSAVKKAAVKKTAVHKPSEDHQAHHLKGRKLLREKIVNFLTDVVYNNPVKIALIVLVVLGLSIWQFTRLTISYNQLELIPQDLPSVVATKQLEKLTGGYGNLFIVLRGNDVKQMKKTADVLCGELQKLPQVKTAVCKQDNTFIKDHLAYLIEPDDLEEAFSLIKKKIRSVTRKEMGMATDDTELDARLKELLDKYTGGTMVNLNDKYNIDAKNEMLLIVLDAKGIPNDLNFSKKLLGDVDGVIKKFNDSKAAGIKLVESDYLQKAPEDGKIKYGITGEYKITYEDSMTMERAILPTSIVAFFGIFIFLIIVLRRFSQMILLMSTLIISVIMTYCFARITLMELNTITSMLAAILMGFGIDFGLYFILRFREEYTNRRDMKESIRQTYLHAGTSSFFSAITSAASFFVLMLADFKGFSHFGLMAGGGVLITAVMMYMFLPVIYLLLDKVWPSFKNSLIMNYKDIKKADRLHGPYPLASRILLVSILFTIGISWFATRIEFDYDSRKFMTGDAPYLVLQDEIEKRFGRKGLPSVVYAPTFEEAKKVHDKLSNREKYTHIQQVISIFTIAPPMEQQKRTREILDKIDQYMKKNLDDLPKELLAQGENKAVFEVIKKALKAKPYTMKEVPPELLKQFRPVPESGEKGYFTLIVPRGVVTDSKQTVEFTKQVGNLTIDGKEYHATGHMILMANLAIIVIRDGKIFPALAGLIILIILLIGYRDPRALLFAMAPLVIGMVWMLGLMYLTNWKINYVNIVVFPVVLGFGISNGIYLYNRYLENRSVMFALRHSGAAVAGSNITALIGWAALFFSGHKGLHSMAELAVFGLASALLVSFTLMPAMLQFSEDRKILIPKGKG